MHAYHVMVMVRTQKLDHMMQLICDLLMLHMMCSVNGSTCRYTGWFILNQQLILRAVSKIVVL